VQRLAQLLREPDGSTTTAPGGRPLERGDLLDAAQVGELLGLAPSTVEDYGRRGLIVTTRLGRHVRFLRADVEAFVAKSRSGLDR
jgi:excisionase family DNA binding protein